jgi:type I restriction enzyme M protein
MTQPRHDSREVYDAVWAACDTFRGAVDPANYKNYVLTMLFLKYLSDMTQERREELSEQYDGDETRIARALRNERFLLPAEADFKYLYQRRGAQHPLEESARGFQQDRPEAVPSRRPRHGR